MLKGELDKREASLRVPRSAGIGVRGEPRFGETAKVARKDKRVEVRRKSTKPHDRTAKDPKVRGKPRTEGEEARR
jgi:hypothetical protein